MKSNTSKREHIYPALKCEMIPITDPAEIAALEQRIRKAEKNLAAREAKENKAKSSKRK
jgi:hypothetical protein